MGKKGDAVMSFGREIEIPRYLAEYFRKYVSSEMLGTWIHESSHQGKFYLDHVGARSIQIAKNFSTLEIKKSPHFNNYRAIQGYLSPIGYQRRMLETFFAEMATHIAIKILTEKNADFTFLNIHTAVSIQNMALIYDLNAPLIYVDKKIVEMMEKTDPPSWFNTDQMPYSVASFCFLENTVNWQGDFVDLISFSREYSFNASGDKLNFKLLSYCNDSLYRDYGILHTSEFVDPSDQQPVRNLILNLLAYISQYGVQEKEISQEEEIEIRQYHKGKRNAIRAALNPRWLTLPKGESVPSYRYEGDRSPHKSPASHWRRGHWRNQPYGNRETPEYKLNWVRPCYINPVPQAVSSPNS